MFIPRLLFPLPTMEREKMYFLREFGDMPTYLPTYLPSYVFRKTCIQNKMSFMFQLQNLSI